MKVTCGMCLAIVSPGSPGPEARSNRVKGPVLVARAASVAVRIFCHGPEYNQTRDITWQSSQFNTSMNIQVEWKKQESWQKEDITTSKSMQQVQVLRTILVSMLFWHDAVQSWQFPIKTAHSRESAVRWSKQGHRSAPGESRNFAESPHELREELLLWETNTIHGVSKQTTTQKSWQQLLEEK